MVLAALAAGCGVLSPSGDCAQRADCPDDSEDVVVLDSSVESPGDASVDASFDARDGALDSADERARDAAPHLEAAADGPDGAPDATNAMDAVARDADAGDGAATSDVAAPDAPASCVPTGPEVCTNGVDDDCNGKVDCADPACTGFQCASPVPTGWLGPVAFWQGAAGASAPACPQGFSLVLDGHAGLGASATNCGCSCTASGQVCGGTGTFHSDQACANPACAAVLTSSSGACTELASNVCGSGGSFALTGVSTSGGSCAAQVTSTIPPAQWTTSARLCVNEGPLDAPGGCPAAGDRCEPAAPSPFGAQPCIYKTGTPPASCPAGYGAAAPAVFYSGFSDSRSCGACTCSGPTGGSCSGTVVVYGGAGCTGTSGSVSDTVGTSCLAYSSLAPSPGSVQAHFVVTPGACSVASPPAPAGALTPTGPITVCCQQ